MTPTTFPQTNAKLSAPSDLDESQCRAIRGYIGDIKGGSLDGAKQIVVAWQPSEEELKELNNGGSVFINFVGGIPPHYVCTTFEDAMKVN